MELEIGEVVQRGPDRYRYLGDGRWERVEVLAKRFDPMDDDMTAGVMDSLSRYGIDLP